MSKHVRGWIVAVACVAVTGLGADLAHAQRGRGAGAGGRGGAVARSAPAVGRAVPRGAVGGYRGGVYRGGVYRRGFVGGPLFWGGWGGWGPGWGAWGPGWWGPGFAGSLWWPGWGWWGAPALYAPPVGLWGISDARLLVKPRNTEVYVDGALAGVVDQYDGVFQSLRLAPGTHRLTLYLEGHRKWEESVYVAPGSTLKVRHTMEALPTGAPEEERPTPAVRAPRASDVETSDITQTAPVPPGPRQRGGMREGGAPLAARRGAGTLAIRVQPPDAEIFIDGERWQAPPSDDPLEVQVSAGRVRVEVRRPGRAPFSTEVVVEPGQTTPLNVSLPERDEPI